MADRERVERLVEQMPPWTELWRYESDGRVLSVGSKDRLAIVNEDDWGQSVILTTQEARALVAHFHAGPVTPRRREQEGARGEEITVTMTRSEAGEVAHMAERGGAGSDTEKRGIRKLRAALADSLQPDPEDREARCSCDWYGVDEPFVTPQIAMERGDCPVHGGSRPTQ